MSRRKQNWNESLSKEVMDEIHAEGTQYKRFTEYHIRLFHEESDSQIDLWSGSGKCMQVGAHSVFRFTKWSELKKFINNIFYQ